MTFLRIARRAVAGFLQRVDTNQSALSLCVMRPTAPRPYTRSLQQVESSKAKFCAPPARVTDPCVNATLSATGVDIRQNIQQAEAAIQQGRMWGITGGSYNEARGLVGALFNYAMVVGTGMPQDIKNLRGPGTPQQRVDAVNISFGVTCPFGAEFCQFSAGAAQTMSGNPDFNGTIKTGLDTPRDNQGIRIGQDMRAAGCHE